MALVGCWHETNTYSARRADLASFEHFELLTGTAIADRHRDTNSIFGGVLDEAARSGIDVHPVFSARAWPSGPADAGTASTLLRRLHAALRGAPDVDAVVLAVHGAMVADGHDDMDLDVLDEVTARYPDAAVASVLDLHGNPSLAFCRAVDVLLGFRTYPHTDMADRGREAVTLLNQTLTGRARWATTAAKLPILSSPLAQGTAGQPLQSLRADADRLTRAHGLPHIGLFPGFAYADVARVGFTVTVTAPAHPGEASDRECGGNLPAAAAAAATLTAAITERRDELRVERPTPATAIAHAQQLAAVGRRPVALVDVADNIGGGGPGDGTALLAALLDARLDGAVAIITDPTIATYSAAAGPGAVVTGRLGARTDDMHGQPVELTAAVERVWNGQYTAHGSWLTGQPFDLGTTAVLRAEHGIRVVVTSRPTPPFHKEQLTHSGIDPASCTAITFKGALAWQADYRDLVATVIEVDTPGVCPLDPWSLPRTHPPATA